MVKNLFRELSMAEVKGYNNLSECQKDIFDTVYKRHLSSMSSDKRVCYSEKYLEEIQIDSDDLAIYFNNGKCFKYKRNKTWQKIS